MDLVTEEQLGIDGYPTGAAVFSEDRRHRLSLSRTWDPALPRVTWMMLNPSKAGCHSDDHTVRKCCGFTKLWGAGGIEAVNCFTFIATQPYELVGADPASLHEQNVEAIQAAIELSAFVVVAWGDHVMNLAKAGQKLGVRAALEARGYALMAGRPIHCLGVTLADAPRHPSRPGYATPLQLAWPQMQPEATHALNDDGSVTVNQSGVYELTINDPNQSEED